MKNSFRARGFAPALSVLSLAVAASLHAQTIELDPVVVSATRIEQKLSDVIPSASVITREEIERSQAATLVDLIQGQPGVEIGRNGGPGSVASIFMRGQASSSVAVFVDGVRVQTDHFGGVKVIDIPPSQIERVEILRGNMSALYGEAATGGVIHIYTRAAADSAGGHASLTYGSRNTVDTSAGYQVKQDGWKAGFSVNRFDTDGFSAQNVTQAPLANPDKDGYERNALFVNLERSVSLDLAFGIQANSIESGAEYDSSSGFSGDLPSHLHHNKTKTDDVTIYSRFKLNEDWSSRLGLTQSNFAYDEFRNRGTGFVNTTRSKGDQLSFEWSNSYRLGSGNAAFGLDVVDATFKSGSPASLTKYKRSSNAFYAGYSGRAGALDYQANARHDSVTAKSAASTIKNNKTTWLLGVGYHLTDDLKITATQSTSFRAPNTAELFTPNGGNPNLKPEEQKGSDLGVQYFSSLGLVKFVYFDTKTSNLITGWNPMTNTAKAKNSGVELSLAGVANSVGYKASYVSQDPRDAVTNDRLTRRAKEYVSFDLTTNVARIDWSASVFWSGTRADNHVVTWDPLTNSNYTVVNLTASKKLTPEWTGRIKVENAFNEKYQLAHGFDAVPRGVFVTLQYQPK
ncbi:MAG: TonB-dependent receptor plug domain-containing protein [Hydrogenophaga sp.]